MTFDDGGSGLNITNADSVQVEIWTSSISGTSGNGADNNDQIRVFLSQTSSFSATADITIDGTSNVRYGMSGTGVVNTTAGSPVTYDYPSGGTQTGSDARSKLTIDVPDAWGTLFMKIELENNSSNEIWCIDDVSVSGNQCITPCVQPDSAASALALSNISTTAMDVSWTNGNGERRIVVAKAGSAITADPQDSTTYVANAVFGTGDSLTNGEYIVFDGNGNSFSLSGLTPGQQYFLEIFEYGCTSGEELYLTAATVVDTQRTLPNDVGSFTGGCSTNSTLELSWTLPADIYTGIAIFARQGATPADPSGDANTFTGENTDFSSAATYGSNGSLVYKGTGTSATISGLTAGLNYTFKAFTYSGDDMTTWSTGVQVSQTIGVPNVSSAVGAAGNSLANLNWINPDAACYDEIMIIASDASVTTTPSGNGTAYLANTTYGSGTNTTGNEYVVFKGTAMLTATTALTNGTTYYFKIFTRNGTEWSSGVEITVTPSTVAVLERGDLAIVAINTSHQSGGDDEICFISFEDITAGTAIDFTDNGYERDNSGEWGDTEGTIRLTRKIGSSTITAGSTICIQGSGSGAASYEIFTCGSSDTNWEVSSLNGFFSYDMNASDQIWIMQNGSWINPSGDHNATYTGNVLYGWTATGWQSNSGFGSTAGSTLHPDNDCFNTDVTPKANPDKVKYTGPTSAATQREWLARINVSDNWTDYTDNTNYFAGGPDYSGSCVTFTINAGGFTDGVWIGDSDTNWFHCSNWDNLQVPDSNTNVVVTGNADRNVVIDRGANFASRYNFDASCRNLTISGDTVKLDAYADTLRVFGNLTVSDTGMLCLSDTGDVEGGIIMLKGDFSDSTGTSGFIPGKSRFIVNGAPGNQTFSGVLTFYDLILNKIGTGNLQLLDDIDVLNNLNFASDGLIDAGTNSADVSIPDSGSIMNAGSNRYIDVGDNAGSLSQSINSTGSKAFPIGNSGRGYDPISFSLTNLGASSGQEITARLKDGSPGTISYLRHFPTGFSGNFPGPCTPGVLDQWVSFDCMISDYWNADGPSDFIYTVSFDIAGGCGGGGPRRIIKAASGTSDWSGSVESVSGSLTSSLCLYTDWSEVATSLTGGLFEGFSDFAVASGVEETSLPVELLYFTAEVNDERKVLLNWATSLELNNDYFIVERSNNGIDFEPIAEVDGAGNSTQTITYSAMDAQPYRSISYYRLRQVDFDGTTEYSPTRVVTITEQAGNAFTLYPNPANTDVYLTSSLPEEELVSIEIVSTIGQLIVSQDIVAKTGLNPGRIDISAIPSGNYLIKIVYNSGIEILPLSKE